MPLEVINSARRYARAAPIGALSENTVEAKEAVALYRKALRWLVGKSEWNCLTVTACPDELAKPECCDIPQGYTYAFAYPENALRLASVCYKSDSKCPPSDLPVVSNRVVKLKGEMRGQKAIVVDCKPIIIEFVCLPDDCDVEAMSEEMREALSHKIASEMFMGQGDRQGSADHLTLARDALREAKTHNARQGDRKDELDCGFIVEARQW